MTKKNLSRIEMLAGVLLSKGRKYHAFNTVMHTLKMLKTIYPKGRPIDLLNSALAIGAPVFYYRRVFVSGRLYELPVPISLRRESFQVSKWIQLTLEQKNKIGHSRSLLPIEIKKLLDKTGDIINRRDAYTDEGLEKNIFKKYLRVKRTVVSRAKTSTKYKAILKRINKTIRKRRFKGPARRISAFVTNLTKRHKGRIYHKLKKLQRKKKSTHILKKKAKIKSSSTRIKHYKPSQKAKTKPKAKIKPKKRKVDFVMMPDKIRKTIMRLKTNKLVKKKVKRKVFPKTNKKYLKRFRPRKPFYPKLSKKK